MNATEAFNLFVFRVLHAPNAHRYVALTSTSKGKQKILSSLDHAFKRAIRPERIQTPNYEDIWEKPCYIFQQRFGFGETHATVREAYDRLALRDGWLILCADATTAIYRPEGRFEGERRIS